MRRGIMALEELNGVGNDVAAEPTDFVDAPENDLADAAVAEGEASAINDGIEEAGETAETLENVRDRMEETLPEGGVSEPEAAALEVAVEHLCARVGFPRNRKVFPAMESFNSKSSRVNATKIAIESIGEKIKSIWAAVMSALRSAWEWIKKWWAGLFNAAKKMQVRAEGMVKLAKDHKGNAAGQKIKTGSFKRILIVDGKALTADQATAASLKSAYSKHTSDKFLNEDRSAVAKKVATDITTQVNKKDENTAAGELQKTLAYVSNATGGQETTSSGIDAPEGTKVYEEKLTFGGQSIFSIVGFSKESHTYSVKMGKTSGSATEEATPDEIEAGSSADVGSLAQAIASHLSKYSKSTNSIQDGITALTNLVSKVQNVKMSNPSGEKLIASLIRNTNAACTQTAVLIKSYDAKVAKSLLDYVGASLGAGNKAAVVPKKDEKKAEEAKVSTEVATT